MNHRDAYENILSVRPGITDPASIAYRRESEILARANDPARLCAEQILPHKLALSRKYVETRTFWGDLGLIVQTVLSKSS